MTESIFQQAAATRNTPVASPSAKQSLQNPVIAGPVGDILSRIIADAASLTPSTCLDSALIVGQSAGLTSIGGRVIAPTIDLDEKAQEMANEMAEEGFEHVYLVAPLVSGVQNAYASNQKLAQQLALNPSSEAKTGISTTPEIDKAELAEKAIEKIIDGRVVASPKKNQFALTALQQMADPAKAAALNNRFAQAATPQDVVAMAEQFERQQQAETGVARLVNTVAQLGNSPEGKALRQVLDTALNRLDAMHKA